MHYHHADTNLEDYGSVVRGKKIHFPLSSLTLNYKSKEKESSEIKNRRITIKPF